jgi:predicted nucleic acid-binding protein
MTLGPSRLPDGEATLVLDASAALNLLGSGRAAVVLRTIGRKMVMVEEAAREVEHDPLGRGPGSAAIEALVAARLLRVVSLSPAACDLFANLIAAPSPDGLDDGEAATIAYALDTGGIPVLDEKKATRIVATFPSPAPLCTLDLLSHPDLGAILGHTGLADAVHSAIQHARMRVQPLFRPWVVSLVGIERLRDCASFSQRWLVPSSISADRA